MSLYFSYRKGEAYMGKDLNGKELGTGISQRKDGKYHARYVDRFGERRSIYGKTLKEVKNKLEKAKAENVLKQNIVNENTTLNEWYTKWMNVYKIPVIRENSVKIYKQIYESKISPVLGNCKLESITKLQISNLLVDLKKAGYKWETLNKVKLLLIDMLDRALEDNFVSKNVARSVRNPINKKVDSYRTLGKDEQETFLECALGTFYYNLFVVALNTGLRPGELFALTEEDIDFKTNMINIRKTLLYEKFDGDAKKEFHIGEPKTKTSIRQIPINSICKAALIKQIMQHNVIKNKIKAYGKSKNDKIAEFGDLLFTTKYGTPLNSELYCEAIRRIVSEINLTRDTLEQMEVFSGHSFRHTFATRCFEAGIAPKTVQAYLGHATLQMTMDLYTSVLDEKKQDDMQLLESTIGVKKQDLSGFSSKIIQLYA